MLNIFTFIASNSVDNVTQIIHVAADNRDNAQELAELAAVKIFDMSEIGLIVDLFPSSNAAIIG